MDGVSISAIIAQLINFWILFFLFKHFLGKKIVDAIEERRDNIKASQAAEEEAQTKMEETQAEADKILAEARIKAGEIEKYATEISKQNTQRALEKANSEAEHIVNSGKAQIDKEKLDMVQSMKAKIVDLSLKLNAKVFGEQTANKQFMEKEYDVLMK